LIDAREEEIDGPLDVVRAGHALADLQLAVLEVDDADTRRAVQAVGAAWLMGEGPERAALVAEARRNAAMSIRGRCRSCCRHFRSTVSAPGESRSLLVGGAARPVLMSGRIDKSWTSSIASKIPSTIAVWTFSGGPTAASASRVSPRCRRCRRWTPVAYYSGRAYSSRKLRGSAVKTVAWLRRHRRTMRRRQRGRVKANGIEIEYEATGNKSDPALLLVMGLVPNSPSGPTRCAKAWLSAASMSSASTIAITGLSTDSVVGLPNIPAAIQKVMKGEKADAPYYLKDMAADAVGLLDASASRSAHGRRLDGRHDRADRGGAIS